MPFDGKEHGRAEHQHLERKKDDWYPIHYFLLTLLCQPMNGPDPMAAIQRFHNHLDALLGAV
jgi:hypothetical protein